MSINRRKMIGLAAAVGASSRVMVAQVAAPAAGTPAPGTAPGRSADEELQMARQSRLRDAQRVAMVKLPPNTEPAFRFRA